MTAKSNFHTPMCREVCTFSILPILVKPAITGVTETVLSTEFWGPGGGGSEGLKGLYNWQMWGSSDHAVHQQAQTQTQTDSDRSDWRDQ